MPNVSGYENLFENVRIVIFARSVKKYVMLQLQKVNVTNKFLMKILCPKHGISLLALLVQCFMGAKLYNDL